MQRMGNPYRIFSKTFLTMFLSSPFTVVVYFCCHSAIWTIRLVWLFHNQSSSSHSGGFVICGRSCRWHKGRVERRIAWSTVVKGKLARRSDSTAVRLRRIVWFTEARLAGDCSVGDRQQTHGWTETTTLKGYIRVIEEVHSVSQSALCVCVCVCVFVCFSLFVQFNSITFLFI